VAASRFSVLFFCREAQVIVALLGEPWPFVRSGTALDRLVPLVDRTPRISFGFGAARHPSSGLPWAVLRTLVVPWRLRRLLDSSSLAVEESTGTNNNKQGSTILASAVSYPACIRAW
jgi:hypothetical protein